MTKNLYKIVCTGAPSSGKSSSLARIREHFMSHGFQVFTVPEIATIILTNGFSLKNISDEQIFSFQLNMLNAQIAMEDTFEQIAKTSNKKSVIVCDRGAMDSSAFVSRTMWQAVLDEAGVTEQKLYGRYDAVVHLTTPAIGFEQFYTTENNAARTETPAQAAVLDKRLKEVWLGHPHLRIIGNYENFDDKINEVIKTISQVVGIPAPLEIEKKFAIKPPLWKNFPVPYSISEIEQTYLINQGKDEARIRKRGSNGAYCYTYTTKHSVGSGQRIETEKTITPQEYVKLLAFSDPERRTIKKRRYCFLYNDQFFELDEFDSSLSTIYPYVLEIELNEINQKICIPPFIEVIEDLTDKDSFSNYNLAKK